MSAAPATPRALLVAGGTGGHLFPALALREALVKRGWRVDVATDPRVGGFIQGVPEACTHIVPSATVSGFSPGALGRTASGMSAGMIASAKLIRRLKPDVVVGFGGYPTVPPLLMARLMGRQTIVHEQNAVMGRANRLLIGFGATLATGFAKPKGSERARRSVHVGNPVREAILKAATPYRPPQPDGPFRLLVFGGSQGAKVFSGLVPGALTLLGEARRARISVVQQARPEDLEATRATYRGLDVPAEVEPFFGDMGRRLADAHLVVSRAGASTVTELSALGRPAILVPYPYALDHDQAENARTLAAAGGGWIVAERDLTPIELARRIGELMDAPEMLAAVAEAARGEGRPDAAERLADLVAESRSAPAPGRAGGQAN